MINKAISRNWVRVTHIDKEICQTLTNLDSSNKNKKRKHLVVQKVRVVTTFFSFLALFFFLLKKALTNNIKEILYSLKTYIYKFRKIYIDIFEAKKLL